MSLQVGELLVKLGMESSGFEEALEAARGAMNGLIQDSGLNQYMAQDAFGGIMKFGKEASAISTGFEAMMSRVQAIAQPTAEEFDILKDKARELGATTAFTSTQVAEAMKYMGMAGWKTPQITNAISDVMSLAAASGEELSTVSDIVTDSMTAFGMGADEASRFANVLAATATNANTDVGKLGYSFQYAGAIAGSLGYSIEDVSHSLGIMASAGLKGTKAGTIMRSLLTNMSSNDKAKKAIADMGVSMYDAEGKARPLIDLMNDLRAATANMTQAEKMDFAKIVGGKTAMSGMLTLLNYEEEGWQGLYSTISAAGQEGATAAQDMQDIMLDNFNGQKAIFESAMSGLKESIGSIINEMILPLMQGGTQILTWLNGLSDSFKKGAVAGGAFLAFIAPAMGMLRAFGKVMAGLGMQIGMFKVGALAAGITAFVAIVSSKLDPIMQKFDALKEAYNSVMKTFMGGDSGASPDGKTAGNLSGWMTDIQNVWKDGEKESDELVQSYLDSFKVDEEIPELADTYDKLGALLKKKQNGLFTEKDIAELQSLIDERNKILEEQGYNLTEDKSSKDTIKPYKERLQEMTDLTEKFSNAFTDALLKTGASDAFAQHFGEATGKIAAYAAGFTKNFKQMRQNGESFWQSVAKGISETNKYFGSKGDGKIYDKFLLKGKDGKVTVASLTEIGDAIKSLAIKADFSTNRIKESFSKGIAEKGLWGGLTDGFNTVSEEMKRWSPTIGKLWGNVGKKGKISSILAMKGMLTGLSKNTKDITAFFKSGGFKDVAGAALDGVSSIVYALSGGGKANLIDSFNKAFSSMDSAELLANISEFGNTLYNGFKTALSKIASAFFGGHIDFAKSLMSLFSTLNAAGVMDMVYGAFDTIVTDIGNAIRGLGGKIAGLAAGFSSEDFATLASTIGGVIYKALTGGAEIGAAFIDGIKTALVGTGEDGTGILPNLDGLIDGITQVLVGAISGIGNGGAVILDAFAGLFEGLGDVDSDAMLASLANLGQSVLNAIVNGLKNIGEGAASLTEAVAGLIKGIDFQAAGEGLGDFAINAVNWISEGFKGLDATGITSAIGHLIASAVEGIAELCIGLGKSIVQWIFSGEAFSDVGELLTSALSVALGTTLEALQTFLQDLGFNPDQGAIDAMKKTDEEIGQITDDINQHISEIEGFDIETFNRGGELNGAIYQIVDALNLGGYDLGGDELKTEIINLFAGLPSAEELIDETGGLTELGQTLYDTIIQSLTENFEPIEVETPEIEVEIPEEPEGLTDGTDTFNSAMDAFEQTLQEKSGKETVVEHDVKLNTKTTSSGGETPTTSSSEPTAVDTPVFMNVQFKLADGTDVSALITQALGIVEGQTVPINVPIEVHAGSVSMAADFSTEGILPDMSVAGGTMTINLASGILAQRGVAVAAATAVGNAANTAFGGSSSAAHTAGANLTAGFTSGIRSGAAAAIAAARAIAAACAQAMKSALDEHSPSKVTEKIGSYFSLGFAEGIQGELNAVRRSAVGIAGVATRATEMANPASGWNSRMRSFAEASNNGIDYDRLATAIATANQDHPTVLTQNGRVVARIQAKESVRAANSLTKSYALGYGK